MRGCKTLVFSMFSREHCPLDFYFFFARLFLECEFRWKNAEIGGPAARRTATFPVQSPIFSRKTKHSLGHIASLA